MKIRPLLLSIFVFLSLLFSGCIPNRIIPMNSTETTEQLKTYPAENPKQEIDQNTNPYPFFSPTQELINQIASSPLTVPTPAVGKSVFFGQMLTPGIGGTPYLGDIYLASLVYANEANQPPLIKFSEESPKAVVNTEGKFFFENIDPGNYALIVYSLGGTYIVSDNHGQTMLVLAEAGTKVDLGIIEIP